MPLFVLSVFLWAIYFVASRKWKKSLMSSMGKWVYDGELDMTFWEWDPDVHDALKELDREFPAAKVLEE